MTKITVLLGATNETNAREQMVEVIQFETELANITTPAENRRDEEQLYKAMSVTDLETLAPFLRWQDFFNSAFRTVSRKITKKERVVVYASDYLKKLNVVMESYMSTEKGNK